MKIKRRHPPPARHRRCVDPDTAIVKPRLKGLQLLLIVDLTAPGAAIVVPAMRRTDQLVALDAPLGMPRFAAPRRCATFCNIERRASTTMS